MAVGSKRLASRIVAAAAVFALALEAARLAGVAAGEAEQSPGAGEPAEPVRAAGLENVFRLTPNVYSGGQPEGAEGFAALAVLGVRTIVSVDAAPPDLKAARGSGLRYVHLPIGYDGAERPQMLAIVAAASELPGPVYVHCHHGKHRGPAAAAWIAMAGGDWPAERALAWLEQAQTSPSYRQLYRQVESFVRPTADELAGVDRSFPEISEVPMLVEQMVEIDRRWQRLEEAAEAAAASDAPLSCNAALDPAHLATLLAEQLRELGRTADAQSRPTDFRALLLESEEASAALARGLAGWKSAAASRFSVEHGLEQVAETCRACHARFRD